MCVIGYCGRVSSLTPCKQLIGLVLVHNHPYVSLRQAGIDMCFRLQYYNICNDFTNFYHKKSKKNCRRRENSITKRHEIYVIYVIVHRFSALLGAAAQHFLR